MSLVDKIFGDYSKKEVNLIEPIKDKVLEYKTTFSPMDDKTLAYQTYLLKERYKNGETLDSLLPEAFAVCREASSRILNMEHYESQIIGGIILHQGRISEMKTGEGKTLVATLPAYLNALSGKGVHIVTVNDYLAKRDSSLMGKLYRFLGLTVSTIEHDMTTEQRQAAYKCDIVYGTNNEFGFDYLRDNMAVNINGQVQREHNFVIIDEIDSILIDEARTPLIISGKSDECSEIYDMCNQFASRLKYNKVEEIATQEDMEATYDGDCLVDEKFRTATLTRSGIKKAERVFGIKNLMDTQYLTLLHCINQATKAYGVMQKDIDYIVNDDEILIVDEFTGRVMNGRRFSDGLHQALEAKEKVSIKPENKTIASITFQNYFRLYKKLSGMTGTAVTERDEFSKTYNLDVVEIPTFRPVIREDLNDIVYATKEIKYKAIIEKVKQCNDIGQPVLIGTTSVEKSIEISNLLVKAHIVHNILNARNHQQEAQIIAQAGSLGTVTVATNMAGRGTDILLGGNAQYLAQQALQEENKYDEKIIRDVLDGISIDNDKLSSDIISEYNNILKEFKIQTEQNRKKVLEIGGLFIIGTERHDSRRIDNQLRGRAGRQGDPGTTRFYLSLEDDLLRLFAGDKIKDLLLKISHDEIIPIETKFLNSGIENAQKNIEATNYASRKKTLEYDDVLHQQRKIIYKQRNDIINGFDIKSLIQDMAQCVIKKDVNCFCNDDIPREQWDINGLITKYQEFLIKKDDPVLKTGTSTEICEHMIDVYFLLMKYKETLIHSSIMRNLEKGILLSNVDTLWVEHIQLMDDLQKSIKLKAYANQDPVVAYKIESSKYFDDMVHQIKENTVLALLFFKIKLPAPIPEIT